MRENLFLLITEAKKICLETPRTITEEKGGAGNWVTQTDLAVEKYLKNKISELYPDHFILAEETLPNFNPSEKENVWVIDPLDGTTNATWGLPIFGIAIAFVKKGEVIAAAVYDNLNKEIYIAEKGKGVTNSKGELLKINEHGLKGGLACTGAPYGHDDYLKQQPRVDAVHAAGSRIVILGSAVIESVSVARNNLNLYFEIGLKPWDVAATKLIIEEAGGVAQSFDGPLDIFNSSSYVCGSRTAVAEFLKLKTV